MDASQDSGAGAQFAGSIPAVYDRLLVPMIFQAAADRLAAAVAEQSPRDILETAAGTGVLTRALVEHCAGSDLTATDLNLPMLDLAAARLADSESITWQQADALDLPFADSSFDVVACQFGAMFFPDKVDGYREARRVLRPDGAFVFNVWDRIEHNEIPHLIESALNESVPHDHFRFMSKIPHGYFSPDQIRAHLSAAGLEDISVTAVDGTARTTASEAATAFCEGTPLRVEIEKHPTLDLGRSTAIAESALLRCFGPGTFEAPIRSFEIIAKRAT